MNRSAIRSAKGLCLLAALATMSLSCLASAPACSASSFPPGERRALVIGNSDYSDGVIVSGVLDASEMTKALIQLNFKVLSVPNGRREQMTKALDDFKKDIKDAAVVVVFYSGHGFQLDGKSYLQPVGASAVLDSTVPLEDVLQALVFASKAARLVFVNACRTIKDLPPGAKQGQAKADAEPGGIIQFFAASPDQLAASGSQDTLSPFAAALVAHIREAGLTISRLFAVVTDEVINRSPDRGQNPSQVGSFSNDGASGTVAADFSFRPAVVVEATVNKADDGLVVVLRNEVAINQHDAAAAPAHLKLVAGENRMELLVFNQKTFHNTQSWERTEGWGYSLLLTADGKELTAAECQGRSPCFTDGEENPFKDGPHHGKVFKVATADLHVDPITAELKLQNVDTRLWDHEAPIWARDQDSLYLRSISSLPLGEIRIGGLIDARDLISLLQNLHADGLANLPDLGKVSVGVRGNRLLRPAVQSCMADEAARMRELNKSIAAIFGGERTPFDSFDRALTQCVQAAYHQAGGTLKDEDIKVWTDIEDTSS